MILTSVVVDLLVGGYIGGYARMINELSLGGLCWRHALPSPSTSICKGTLESLDIFTEQQQVR